jgi:hypothetical protein
LFALVKSHPSHENDDSLTQVGVFCPAKNAVIKVEEKLITLTCHIKGFWQSIEIRKSKQEYYCHSSKTMQNHRRFAFIKSKPKRSSTNSGW